MDVSLHAMLIINLAKIYVTSTVTNMTSNFKRLKKTVEKIRLHFLFRYTNSTEIGCFADFHFKKIYC